MILKIVEEPFQEKSNRNPKFTLLKDELDNREPSKELAVEVPADSGLTAKQLQDFCSRLPYRASMRKSKDKPGAILLYKLSRTKDEIA